MKKLGFILAVLAIVAFTAPAMAVDWNFYGHVRMGTWYETGDAPGLATKSFAPTHVNNNLDQNDSETIWDLYAISRIGAKVKHEGVSGYFEYGNDSHPNNIWLRKLYATWKPQGTNWRLLIGQTYTPIDVFYSGQSWNEDEGLLSTGQAYDSRNPQITFIYNGFKLAFITVKGARDEGADFVGPDGAAAGADIDVTIPKIEASYHFAMNQFFFDVIGGYQTYKVENPTSFGGDFTVDSYIFGGGGGVNFGPAYAKAFGYYGQNTKEFGMYEQGVADAVLVGSGNDLDVEDTNTYGFLGVLGFKVNDMLKLEGGYGYLKHTNDLRPVDSETYAFYFQAPITLAKGVFIVPEVGHYDYGNDVNTDADLKDFTYFGAKWQINF